jgi:hypothetical protein
MELKPRFYLIGLVVAFLEEFITQGVLKRNLVAWIIPALIAFLPFLIVVRQISKPLERRMVESKAVSAYYVISGVIGLMIEWLVIGLSPWSNPAADPLLTTTFQFGIFSFWGSVAFAPKLLLDKRTSIARVRRWYKAYLALGFVSIYLFTSLASRDTKFVVGIGSVLATFIPLNLFYLKYVRTLRKQVDEGAAIQSSSA